MHAEVFLGHFGYAECEAILYFMFFHEFYNFLLFFENVKNIRICISNTADVRIAVYML